MIHKNENIYENLEDYNPEKKRRVLILFDNMVSDFEARKNQAL